MSTRSIHLRYLAFSFFALNRIATIAPNMTASDQNPYEPPTSQVSPVVESAAKIHGASVVWFFVVCFAFNFVAFIYMPAIRGRPVPLTLKGITSILPLVSLAAGSVALVALFGYAIINLAFKRRYPATRLSRTAAAILFTFILWLGALVVVETGFKGPPFFYALPIAVPGSILVDRFFSRLQRRENELDSR